MLRFVFLALVGIATALAIWLGRPAPEAPRFDHDGSVPELPVVAAEESSSLDGTVARAVVSDGSTGLYVCTREGRLFALEPGPSLRWARDLPAGVEAPIASDEEGGVTVGTLDGTVLSFTRDGELRWTERLPDPVRGGVAVRRGSARTFVAAGRLLWALDRSGRRSWSFQTGEEIRAQPLSVGGRVYVASRDDQLYALDETTGAELWRFAGGADFDVGPRLGPSGEIYLAGDDGWLRALSADGVVLWRLQLGVPIRAPLGATRDGDLLLRTSGAAPELWRIRPGGQRRWVARLALHDAPGRATVSPAVELSSGEVVAATMNQELLVFDPDGRPAARMPLPGAVSAPPVASEELLYVVTRPGLVRVLRFRDEQP